MWYNYTVAGGADCGIAIFRLEVLTCRRHQVAGAARLLLVTSASSGHHGYTTTRLIAVTFRGGVVDISTWWSVTTLASAGEWRTMHYSLFIYHKRSSVCINC